MPNQFGDDFKFSKIIENRIREGIRNGLTIAVIHDSIMHLNEAPNSKQTFYKIYGEVIADERARFQSRLGQKANDILDNPDHPGHTKILELALRAKAGWNPSVKIEEKTDDSADENLDAISALMLKLGKEVPKELAKE